MEKIPPRRITRLPLAIAAAVVSALGCAQVPTAQPPSAAPRPVAPAVDSIGAIPGPTRPDVPRTGPSAAPQPGPISPISRYGGAMGYQGGANMRSFPDTSLRDALWRQLLGPTPAQTGQGSWGYAPPRANREAKD